METTTELISVQQTPSFFMNKEVFEHGQRVATMLSKSDLVPKTFQGNIGNCVIALNMANRMGADPLMVMQNLYIVHGKPAWSSKFLIATLNASGKFSAIKYEESDLNGGSTRAYATDKSDNQICYGAWVSMQMAEAEGWISKNGSKWKTMPEVMRRYRAASFFVNQFAPEVSMGIQTEYEVQDIPFEEIKPDKKELSQVEIEHNRKLQMLASCKTLSDLDQLCVNNPDFDSDLIAVRKKELTPVSESKNESPQELQKRLTLNAKQRQYDDMSDEERASDKGLMLAHEIATMKGEAK